MFSHAKLTATMLGCYGWLLRCLAWILGVPYSTCLCGIFICFIIEQMKSYLTAHLDSQHLIVKINKRPVILSLRMYIVFCIHIVLINDETTIINSNNNSLCFVHNISSTYYIYILSRNSLLTCKGPKINFSYFREQRIVLPVEQRVPLSSLFGGLAMQRKWRQTLPVLSLSLRCFVLWLRARKE